MRNVTSALVGPNEATKNPYVHVSVTKPIGEVHTHSTMLHTPT